MQCDVKICVTAVLRQFSAPYGFFSAVIYEKNKLLHSMLKKSWVF